MGLRECPFLTCAQSMAGAVTLAGFLQPGRSSDTHLLCLSTRAFHHGGLQAFLEVSGEIFKGLLIANVVCTFLELGHSQLGHSNAET